MTKNKPSFRTRFGIIQKRRHSEALAEESRKKQLDTSLTLSMTKERYKYERNKINPIEMSNFHLMKQ